MTNVSIKTGETVPPGNHTWRRFARFSVRGLIVLVMVFGVVMSWIVQRARVQREAVAAVKKAGGHLRYDWQYKDGRTIRGGKPRGPQWLVDRLGADYFDTITVVLGGQAMSDADLVKIGKLAGLEELNLGGSTAVTNAGLARVKELTQLRQLYLRGTQVTDAGLAYVKVMPGLTTLWLDGSKVTDAGLEHLKEMHGLKDLRITDKVTDAGLIHLAGLVGLQSLHLDHASVTDSGLPHLARLTSLQTLGLADTAVSNAGMIHLTSLTSLRTVFLNRTAVSDDGLIYLSGLTRLERLFLGETKVTAAGVKQLEAILPKLKISRRAIEFPIARMARNEHSTAGPSSHLCV